MAEPSAPPPSMPEHHGSKTLGLLSKETAGLPNWAWLVIIGIGFVAAVVIPKLLNKKSAAASATDTNGIGLAVDPTTGLPYAVEGLVPSGGLANNGTGGGIPIIQPAPGPTGPPVQSPPTPPPPPKVAPKPQPVPHPAPERFVTVQPWPNVLGSLSGIASQNGISLERVEQLNPQIQNPDLIYPGQRVRVA